MLTKINRILLLALFAVAVSFASAKEPVMSRLGPVAPEGLSRAQAKKVLMVVLRHQYYKLGKPGVFIDDNLADENGNPPHLGYFDFSLGYEDQKAGATEYWGLFSVSPLTGDVWEINTCKQFIFPLLQQIQKGIMEKTGKKLTDEKAQRRGLGCANED